MMTYLIAATFYMNTLQAPSAPLLERRSYIIILKNSQEFPVFWEQRTELPNDMVRLELDTPWEPGTKMFKRSEFKEEPVEERPERRKDRIKKGWEERHYTEVNGQYYPADEVELARRARQMAGVADKTAEPEDEPVAPEPGSTTEPAVNSTATAPLQGWKLASGYVGVVGIAALLAGIIIRKMVLPGA